MKTPAVTTWAAARAFGVLAALVLLFGFAALFLQPLMMRDEVLRTWDAHMLAGTGGSYRKFFGGNWQTSNFTPVTTWLAATGSLELRRSHILVADLTGRGGSGWLVAGGPIARIDLDEFSFELYGRALDRYVPGFFEGMRDERNRTYDFFLIRRSGGGKSMILQQWLNVGEYGKQKVIGTMNRDSQQNRRSCSDYMRWESHPGSLLLLW